MSRCDRGLGAGDARLRLLGVLHAAITGGGQIGVAFVFLRGEGNGGAVDIDGCPGRIDHRLLNPELGLLARDRGLRRRDIGPGLVERHLKVALVDPGQHLTGADRLVVADLYLAQIAGDLRRDGGVVRLHIGVVGGDQILADGPIIPAVPDRAGQHCDRRAGH